MRPRPEKCLGKVKYLICRDGEAQRGKRRKYNKLMEEKKKTKGNGGKHLDKKKYFEFLIYKEPWGSKALAR